MSVCLSPAKPDIRKTCTDIKQCHFAFRIFCFGKYIFPQIYIIWLKGNRLIIAVFRWINSFKVSQIDFTYIDGCCSVAKSCPTLWDSTGCSFPVPHHLPEFAQDHVHLNQWCHPPIFSSVALFSFCPASRSIPMSQLFALGGQLYW